MALIACPECQKQISDRATACPQCGNPMQPIRVATAPGQAVTTEETAKRFKGWQLVGGAGVALGVVFMIAEYSMVGALIASGGLVVYLIARFNAWWYHG